MNIAICKCAAHKKLTDDISKGDHKADEAAQTVATDNDPKTAFLFSFLQATDTDPKTAFLFSLPQNTDTDPQTTLDTDLLNSMQIASPESEKHRWLCAGATVQNNQTGMTNGIDCGKCTRNSFGD